MFQQCLLSIAGALVVPLLVAEAVCAENDDVFIRNMLSSTMLMSGIATFMQTSLGIRLPLYQGPSGGYIVPLIALREIDKDVCSVENQCKCIVNTLLKIFKGTLHVLPLTTIQMHSQSDS